MQINSINLENLVNFLILNKFIFLFGLIILIGITQDNRFCIKRKILFSLVFILCILLGFLCNNLDFNIFIKDLFWYSLILNSSFIFHILICDWIYKLFLYLNWYYGCFIITRISFILSLSFILYLLNLIYLYINMYKIKYVKNKIFLLIIEIFCLIIFSIINILLYFVINFSQYNLILMGKINNFINFKIIIKFISYFLITIIISMIILGIPRLYLIWFIILVVSIRNFIKKYYPINNIKDLGNKLIDNIQNNIKNYGNDYLTQNTKSFNYSFLEFINYTYILIGNNIEYPLQSPFIYYNEKYLILTYIRSYIKRFISLYNYISKKNVNIILKTTKELFFINEEEFIILEKKIYKIYKKSIIDIY